MTIKQLSGLLEDLEVICSRASGDLKATAEKFRDLEATTFNLEQLAHFVMKHFDEVRKDW